MDDITLLFSMPIVHFESWKTLCHCMLLRVSYWFFVHCASMYDIDEYLIVSVSRVYNSGNPGLGITVDDIIISCCHWWWLKPLDTPFFAYGYTLCKNLSLEVVYQPQRLFQNAISAQSRLLLINVHLAQACNQN